MRILQLRIGGQMAIDNLGNIQSIKKRSKNG
jgi:hypothetical protein